MTHIGSCGGRLMLANVRAPIAQDAGACRKHAGLDTTPRSLVNMGKVDARNLGDGNEFDGEMLSKPGQEFSLSEPTTAGCGPGKVMGQEENTGPSPTARHLNHRSPRVS